MDELDEGCSEEENENRADVAVSTMEAYLCVKCSEEDRSNLTDLLADLMHMCARDPDQYGKFDDCLASARINFEAEQG